MNAASGKAKEIFVAALKLPADQWDSYLAEACGADDELCKRVRDLLHANAEAGSFLEPPAAAPAVTVDHVIREGPGTIIGPYKLLEQIGEGGMGLVFMAEQQQPVRRKVALKILKPGMDTRHVIARFEAERQALALMDHPNIARVLDAGETASGRPHFVMELVRGVSITDFCDQNRLSTRERLELFAHVCQAVQHAHHKGIIHRDIKPSNVMVTLHDAVPVVKMIDFGIAKALGQQLTEKTLHTGFAQMVGTPMYMSPEQAQLSGLDIDTRSDIYSLGVLLYELLTGTTPFDKDRLSKVSYDEMRRIIREEEPPRPSTRLSTLGEAGVTASARRQSCPKRLSLLLRGELDWIVMKALEKDRNRRYETASAFAADVQRYLHDEPVLACPPSAWYRFGKFARRNKTGLAVAGLIFFFIASLAGGSGWVMRDRAAREARTASDLDVALDRVELFQGQGKRAEAQAALDRAELLAGQASADTPRSERLAELKERLAADARDQAFIARFEDIRLKVQSRVMMEENRFTEEAALPDIQDALHRYGIEIGDMTPIQVAARVQGRPEPVRRGLLAALDECLRPVPKGDARARQWLLATLAAADTDAWRVRVRKAAADEDWKALERLAREADVEKQLPSFLLIAARFLPARMKSTRLELLRRVQRAHQGDLWANFWLAFALVENGRPAEAVHYYTAALALRPDNETILNNRGNALLDAGEVDAAIMDHRQILARAPRYAAARIGLGRALRTKGRLDDAIAEYREAIRLNKDRPEAHNGLGAALFDKGKLNEAVAAFRVAIGLKKDYVLAHFNLGNALRARGQLNEAFAEYREANRLDNDFPAAHYALGKCLMMKGQLDQAIAEFQEAIRLDKDFVVAHNNLGSALSARGQPADAVIAFSRAIQLGPKNTSAWGNRGADYTRLGEYELAVADFSRAIELEPTLAKTWCNRGAVYSYLGRYDRALADYQQALKLAPAYARAYCVLAELLASCPDTKLHDPARAVELAQKAVQLAPEDRNSWYTLGVAHFRAGEYMPAIVALERTVKLRYGENAAAFFFLAMAHGKLGRRDEARRWHDKALAWMQKYKGPLEKTRRFADELRHFRSEAEAILEQMKK